MFQDESLLSNSVNLIIHIWSDIDKFDFVLEQICSFLYNVMI